MPTAGRHRGVRLACAFLAVVLGGLGALFLSLAPSVAEDVRDAQLLAARGVRTQLQGAHFSTQVVHAIRAVGSDGCQLSGVRVTYALGGALHTAALGPRYVRSTLLPNCADALAAAADDYPKGTALLVDPRSPTLAGVAAEVPAVAEDTAYATQTAAVGGVLLTLGVVAATVLALVVHRTRSHAVAAPLPGWGPRWGAPPP